MVIDSNIFNRKSQVQNGRMYCQIAFLFTSLDTAMSGFNASTVGLACRMPYSSAPFLSMSLVRAFRFRRHISDETNGRSSKIYRKRPLRQVSSFYMANHEVWSIHFIRRWDLEPTYNGAPIQVRSMASDVTVRSQHHWTWMTILNVMCVYYIYTHIVTWKKVENH